MLPTGLARALSGVGYTIDTRSPAALGRGSVGNAWRLRTRSGEVLFLKTGEAGRLETFEAEREALLELARPGVLRLPRPLAVGQTPDTAFLLLEYLDLSGPKARASPALGEGLARLHRETAPRFGWHRDNAIGATPQENSFTDDWVTFWREKRLGFQFDLARQNGHGSRLDGQAARLLDVLPAFFTDYRPAPSLLHGDLWGGNWGATADGTPVIFDPATYYGDRETDLAMTELFGGFGKAFYSAYGAVWPLDDGYRIRRDLYNLYHVLNHLNLFGGAYLGQAEAMLARLLVEV